MRWNVGEFLRALDLRMGGEDLLDERRSGAWQPDNENRIRVRRADARARGEKLAGAHLDLLARVGFGDFRMVAAFGALERVAALVKLPGFRILVPVLERFAEREAQMVAIDSCQRPARLPRRACARSRPAKSDRS